MDILLLWANYSLVFEVFGEGNVILVEEEGRILQAMQYRKMRDRNILRGEVFKLPPTRGLNPMGIKRQPTLEELKGQADTIIRALTNRISLGGLYSEEVLLRAKIDKKRIANTLSDDEIKNLYNEANYLIRQAFFTTGRWIRYTQLDRLLKSIPSLSSLAQSDFTTTLTPPG
jgi:predicted ribosome quality control (RQC) complex YloA/Tae2 family protein